ncbi:hypothetical protein [Streptomyces chartreusis]
MTTRKWPARNLWIWAQYPIDWSIILNNWGKEPKLSEAGNYIVYARKLIKEWMPLVKKEMSEEDHFDLKLAIQTAARIKSAADEALREIVPRVVDQGYSWSEVAETLGKSRKTVWKTFHAVDYEPYDPQEWGYDPDDPEGNEGGPLNLDSIAHNKNVAKYIDVVLTDLIVQAKCDTWYWGHPYTRVKGMTWAEIAHAVGKSLNATHAKYRHGLSIERYQQLDEELNWERGHSPAEGDFDDWFTALMRMRRQTLTEPHHTR